MQSRAGVLVGAAELARRLRAVRPVLPLVLATSLGGADALP